MNASEPRELELTDDLLEYATAVARKEAGAVLRPGQCHPGIDLEDVVQEALLLVMSKPPKYDPSRGAKPKTLLYTAVKYAVLKAVGRAGRQLERFEPNLCVTSGGERGEVGERDQDDDLVRSARKGAAATERSEDRAIARGRRVEQRKDDRGIPKHRGSPDLLDKALEFIDNEKSRAFCRLFVECDGNVSEMARRLNLTEGAIRHRRDVLLPKLKLTLEEAGYDPLALGGAT